MRYISRNLQMKGNRIIMTGVLALVVVGCIFAAGCTSESATVTDDMIVGTWNHTTEVGGMTVEKTDVFRPDGIGVEYQIYNNEYMLTKMFTWNRFENSDGARFDVAYIDGGTDTFTYSIKADKLTSSSGGACTRMQDAIIDPVVDTWIVKLQYEGATATAIHVFKCDGTGLNVGRKANGKSVTYPFTWEKSGDTYYLTYCDGSTATAVLDADSNTLKWHDEEGVYDNMVCEDIASVGLDPVVNTWVGSCVQDGLTITVKKIFRADGSGSMYEIAPDGTTYKYNFIWQSTDSGYTLQRNDGETDSCVYDSGRNTLTFKDGMVMKAE